MADPSSSSSSSIPFTIDDTSPTLSYTPFRDTLSVPNLPLGWNPYYELSGFANAPGSGPAQQGSGTSYHITAMDGAKVGVQWFGTGIQLYGNTTGSAASYSITLDGGDFETLSSFSPSFAISSTSEAKMLVDIQNLPNTQHSLVLTARIDAQLSAVAGGQGQSMVVFDKAVVFAPGSRVSVPPTSTSSASPTPTYTPRPLPDDSIAFLGRWSFETAPSASSGSASPDYHSSSTVGDRAVVRVNGTSALRIHGLSSPSSGSYSVSLTSLPSNTTILSSGVLNAQASFIQYDTLLWYATGLDGSVEYEVAVRNEGNGGTNVNGATTLGLVVDGFVSYEGSNVTPPATTPLPTPTLPPTPGSNVNTSYAKGTIAAFALAGILAFLLFTAALFACFVWAPRRRGKRRRVKQAAEAYAAEGRGRYSAYGGAGGGGGAFDDDYDRRYGYGSYRFERGAAAAANTGTAEHDMHERERSFGSRWLGLGLGLSGTASKNERERATTSPKEQEAFSGLVGAGDWDRDGSKEREPNITDVANRLSLPYHQRQHAQHQYQPAPTHSRNQSQGNQPTTPVGTTRTASSHRSQSTTRSGWAKWRREAMEGFGSKRGLALPIKFRHSSTSAIEKVADGSYGVGVALGGDEKDEGAGGGDQRQGVGYTPAEVPYENTTTDTELGRAVPRGSLGTDYPYGYPYAHAYLSSPPLPGSGGGYAQRHERTISASTELSGSGASGAAGTKTRRNLKAIALANLKNKGKARQITGASSASISLSGGDGSSHRTTMSTNPGSPGLTSKITYGGSSTAEEGYAHAYGYPQSASPVSASMHMESSVGHSGPRSRSMFDFLHWHPQRQRSRSHSSMGGQTTSASGRSDRDRMGGHSLPLGPGPRHNRLSNQPIHELEALAIADDDEHPPSYAASISHSRPGSEGSSSLLQSVPRSVSRSGSNSTSNPASPVNLAYHRPSTGYHHQRENSRGFLLHSADSEDEVADTEDSPPEPESVTRPHPLPPPPRPSSGSFPPSPSNTAQVPMSMGQQQQLPGATQQAPLLLSIPGSGDSQGQSTNSINRRDRGSASTDDNNTLLTPSSVIGPGSSSMRQLLRSLSPRTSTNILGGRAGGGAGRGVASMGYVYAGRQQQQPQPQHPSRGLLPPLPYQRHSSIGEEGSLSDSDGGSPVEFARNVSPSGVVMSLGGEARASTGAEAGPGPSPGSEVYTHSLGQTVEQGQARAQASEPLQGQADQDPVLNIRPTSPFEVDFTSGESTKDIDVISPTVGAISSGEDSGMESAAAYYTAPSTKSLKPSRRSSSDGVTHPTRTPEFVQGTSRAPFRLTNLTIPPPPSVWTATHGRIPSGTSEGTSDGVTSFLDFTSSREGSVRSRSVKTVASEERVFGGGSGGSGSIGESVPFPAMLPVPSTFEPRSRWSNTTMPSVASHPVGGSGGYVDESQPQAGESPTALEYGSGSSSADSPSSQKVAAPRSSDGVSIARSNTFPISVHLTIPPSPHHIMDFQIQSEPPIEEVDSSSDGRPLSHVSDITQENPVHVHPILGNLESPTESIPKSVSDVHFQDSDSDDNRGLGSSMLRTAGSSHPALPGLVRGPGPTNLTTTLRQEQGHSRFGSTTGPDYTPLEVRYDSDSGNELSHSDTSRTIG